MLVDDAVKGSEYECWVFRVWEIFSDGR